MWAHSVGVGQRVVEGATLLIVEVMKTEFPVESPSGGTVTWLAACGEAIEADALVAIVES